jgi:hypothetical protein
MWHYKGKVTVNGESQTEWYNCQTFTQDTSKDFQTRSHRHGRTWVKFSTDAIPPMTPHSPWPRQVANINYKKMHPHHCWDNTFKASFKDSHNRCSMGNVYIRWTGYIEIQTADTYTFYTACYDHRSQCRLSINDTMITSGEREKNGAIQLPAGKYAFWMEYTKRPTGWYHGAILSYKGADTADVKKVVPASALSTTLEGSKKLIRAKQSLAGSGDGFCKAFSHHGNHCIIYNECQGVSKPQDMGVCEEKNSFEWLTDLNNLQTCTYDEPMMGDKDDAGDQTGGDATGDDTLLVDDLQ